MYVYIYSGLNLAISIHVDPTVLLKMSTIG